MAYFDIFNSIKIHLEGNLEDYGGMLGAGRGFGWPVAGSHLCTEDARSGATSVSAPSTSLKVNIPLDLYMHTSKMLFSNLQYYFRVISTHLGPKILWDYYGFCDFLTFWGELRLDISTRYVPLTLPDRLFVFFTMLKDQKLSLAHFNAYFTSLVWTL